MRSARPKITPARCLRHTAGLLSSSFATSDTASKSTRTSPDKAKTTHGLLPEKSFKAVLEDCENNPEAFVHAVGQLWEAMDLGTWAHVLKNQSQEIQR